MFTAQKVRQRKEQTSRRSDPSAWDRYICLQAIVYTGGTILRQPNRFRVGPLHLFTGNCLHRKQRLSSGELIPVYRLHLLTCAPFTVYICLPGPVYTPFTVTRPHRYPPFTVYICLHGHRLLPFTDPLSSRLHRVADYVF